MMINSENKDVSMKCSFSCISKNISHRDMKRKKIIRSKLQPHIKLETYIRIAKIKLKSFYSRIESSTEEA
jgi:hypothetical protein